jgi:predicted nuclease of restriction endonuclease-like (RecB) superfamily
MKINFSKLVDGITQVHRHFQAQAVKAVNVSLTVRNWLIGCYIREYELKGSDRAAYGERLLGQLALRLSKHEIPRTEERELRRYRQFYLTYPQIREAVPPEFVVLVTGGKRSMEIRESAPPELRLPGKTIVERFSFTQLAELLQLTDPLQRAFYEIECLRGNWSSRELQRQIASLYYERSGLSRDKKKLARLAHAKAELTNPAHAIRDPYVFDFLGIKAKEALSETALEKSLLNRIQDFLLELGRGFCFEARQKRIVIGAEHYFVDLVFYHRILRCHILLELKADRFRHEYLGQLNTYVNWYGAHERLPGDGPPIGILLCTEKDHALVQYALAGMDNRLFVSKYQLKLPKKEELRRFLEEQITAVRPMLQAKKEITRPAAKSGVGEPAKSSARQLMRSMRPFSAAKL